MSRSGNLPGLVVSISYVKEYVLSLNNLLTQVLYLLSHGIFTKELMKSFLIDIDISMSRLAGSYIPLRIL